ncbi:hypothetical protein MFIFM68171_11175 [Madurella fahalii]|uniref:Uncharacterized protein n=1 Tax=Madurella fahalii TaxID=1157608 RepID=A0ABQ0GTA0_9PEZI
MTLSPDGKALLTKDYNGMLSIWSVPQFQLMYQLQETGVVRGLAFSPNGQRFYDIRGPLCNVWEPDALIRPEGSDREELSHSYDTSLSEPISAVAVMARPEITTLVSDAEDRFFCYGDESGAVVMHDMKTGERNGEVAVIRPGIKL